jgi:leucyl-tRNA synthetase
MKRYNPAVIEPKWQNKWADTKIYAARDFDDKPKYTVLTEFPYPSGAAMHMGHAMTFTGGDIVARHKRALGYNVLFPMGFDAFGLPAENYAIKHKITPQSAVEQNITHFRKQLDQMGYSIDWNRSFSTTDPEYYKWTQWFFLQFFKSGLAYQDEIAINWCPFCKTGLANEEVINGRHERCDNLVEKKLMKQWMLRITDYAERLIAGLATVDYPSRIADQQVNWIGKSVGAEIDFAIDGSRDIVKVFTTRPDTIFGATFMVLAPEHPLVEKITTKDQKADVESYIKIAQSKSDIERQENKKKTGVFTGAYATNPATKEKIPIWVADYIMMGYGTGAIMAVPAHDERDYEFAQKFDLPIIEVISGGNVAESAYVGVGIIINSGQFSDSPSDKASEKITKWLAEKGVAKQKTEYKLRDWVYSRQR